MIFLSVGHHQNAQGASFGGITEYQLAQEWANEIMALIGDKVDRVPHGTLKEKVGYINDNRSGKDLAVEIHFNSAKLWRDQNANGVIDDGEMKNVGVGCETLYYPSSITGIKAAEILQHAMSQVLPPNRGVKEGWYQMNPAKGADFFLKRTRCTSLIIEPEFIDNLEVLSENKHIACTAIATALLEAHHVLFD